MVFVISFRKLLALLCVLALSGLRVQAQISRVSGLVSGTVADSSGAPVAGAHVTVSATDGVAHSTNSTADGSFSLLNLPTGIYRVNATASGFAPYTNSGISVAIGRNVQLSIVVRPAGSKETVTVSAQGNTLDTSQTSSVTNIDKDRVEELPIQSRNYLVFTLLAPQVGPANPAIARAADRTNATSGPGVLVSGIIQFGTPYAGNDRRFETHSELDESLLRQHGKHLFQVGASIDHVGLRSENSNGYNGLYVFQNLAALSNGMADFYTQSFGNPDTNFLQMKNLLQDVR